MKSIHVLLATLSLGGISRTVHAEQPLVIRLQQPVPDVQPTPMERLPRAIDAHPRQNGFLMFFRSQAPMGQPHVKVNFNRKARTPYVSSRDGWLGSSLIRFSGVTPAKLRRCLLLKRKTSQSSIDNFDLLEDVGCPSRELFSKAGYVSP